MVSCDICGKEFKNTQGLKGHKNFVHSDTGSGVGQSVAQQATQQPLSSNLGTRVNTEQRLSQLEDRFARLEHVTGVRETDELEKLLGITDTPLTEQVNQLSEQLSKLTEQLKYEYVSRETMENIAAELSGESDSLHKEIIVNSSIGRVFSYISEPSNWPEFWPGLMEIEDIQPLPNGGYKAKYEYKMAGMRFKGTGEYTEFVPNHWIVVQTKGGIQSTITCTFRSIEDNTRISLTIEYKVPVPLLGKLAEFVILKMNDQEADLVRVNLRARFLMDY